MANARLKKLKGDSYYGKTARDYETKRHKQAWWWVEQEKMQELLHMLPENLNVLDVPFGTGRFVKFYHARGHSVSGLDASDEIMKTAHSILGADYEKCRTHRGYSTDLPFEDGEFDLVVSTRFLRDIVSFGDAKKTIEEFARVSKGYAILQLGYRVNAPFDKPQDDERMGSRMSREDVIDLLTDYGFEEIESRKVKELDNGDSEIHHFLLKRRFE